MLHDAPSGTSDRRRGIDRVVTILELLLRERRPMGAGEIARSVGAPRSTVYEIVGTLVKADMLEPVGQDGQVYFGRAMHLFGWAYGHQSAQRQRITEALDRLSAETGQTVQLCALRGNKYVVLDCRESTGPFRISSDVGVEVPIPWTASGRLLLAHMSDDAIRAFVPPGDFGMPDGSVLPIESFLADVARARLQGFSETTGMAARYTHCIAAPIHEFGAAPNKALCFVLPADLAEEPLAQFRARLLDAARNLSLTGSRPA